MLMLSLLAWGDNNHKHNWSSAHSHDATNDSYEISTCQELQDIRSLPKANYKLVKDIDCAGFDYGNGFGFMPIFFEGIFDGNGFAIKHLTIYRPNKEKVAL